MSTARIRIISLLSSLVLLGCATSTGVVPIGAGVYYITIQSPQVSFGPPVSQKAEAYKQANEYCQSSDSIFEQVDMKEVNQIFGRHGSVQLSFKCVPKK